MAFGLRPLRGDPRDKNSSVAKKHGDTLIGTLRETHGPGFAHGADGDAKLNDVLHKLDERSLRKLVRDTPGAGWA